MVLAVSSQKGAVEREVFSSTVKVKGSWRDMPLLPRTWHPEMLYLDP